MLDRFVRLWKRLDPCVGIDFSSDTIRLCSVGAGGMEGAFNLNSVQYRPDGSDPRVYGAMIRAALGDKSSHCVIGIPPTDTFVTTALLPAHMSLEDAVDLRRWAIAQVPIDEADIEVSVDVRPSRTVARGVASIAAVKRTTLTWYLSIADAAELTVESVTLRQSGLARGICSLSGSSPRQNQVVIDGHEARTAVHIFRGVMWLGSFEIESDMKLSHVTRAHLLEWLDTHGFDCGEPTLVSCIGGRSLEVSVTQSDGDCGALVFNPRLFGPEVYAVGLMENGRGVA